jgi:uncharacterized protein (DUF924 family)
MTPVADPAVPALTTPDQVVAFWRDSGPQRWFAKDPAFDRDFLAKCGELHEQAAAGGLEVWLRAATPALALVLLLDQFPRNAFRDSPRMFATDALARTCAAAAIAAGFDTQVEAALRMFFYLPLEHSESLADQERSVQLHEAIGFTQYAIEHRDIIRRFGRFPHRNRVLGRPSTAEEQAFLEQGGFGG